jgi:hypothetical protein
MHVASASDFPPLVPKAPEAFRQDQAAAFPVAPLGIERCRVNEPAYDSEGPHWPDDAVATSSDEIRALANWSKREKLSEREAAARLDLIEKIRERRLDLNAQPLDVKPRFLIGKKSISTPGNLTVLQAQAGTGKTNFVWAFPAARCVAESGVQGLDCLGLRADPSATGKLIIIDTEQSAFDLNAAGRRALRRAGAEAEPEWLCAYGLAGISAKELRLILRALLWNSEIDGIHSVIIDGFGDLVCDVNDSEETDGFVSELHGLAIKYDCPIIGVLHENPGSDNGKGRGHLGSQLERKAETVLRLQKTDEVTAVFSKKARRAPILESEGPRFRWSDEAGMHVSCETIADAKDAAKRDRLFDQAEAVFTASSSVALSWGDMRAGIAKSEGIGMSGAAKRFDAMKAMGVIRKDEMGMWRLSK